MPGFRILLPLVPLLFLVCLREAVSDGDVLITQLRTDAIPGVTFDSVHADLYYGGMLAGEVTHPADPGLDYARGVRISEWTLGPGFDSGYYFGTMTLKLGEVVVAARPYRVEFNHIHPHEFIVPITSLSLRVLTVLISHAITPIDVATKTASLEDDRDASGSFSSGDLVRYTTTFQTTHEVGRGSFYRDDLDPDLRLVPGSVTTTHGVVFRGNLPADSEIDVRFGPVASGQIVTITYLADVEPFIENQGVMRLNSAGTAYDYQLLTDNPDTVEEDDPTVVALTCLDGEPPVLPTETISLFPPNLDQYGAGQLIIRGEGFGTADGNPSFMMGGQIVEAMSNPGDGNTEVVTVPLTPEMFEVAGTIPWTLTPFDKQLPPVGDSIGVQPAPEVPEHIGAHYAGAIADAIGAHLLRGLDDYRRARDRTFADPGHCSEFRDFLVSDMGHYSEFAEFQIMSLGLTAMNQAAQSKADKAEMAEIVRITEDGVTVLNAMMSHLTNTLGPAGDLSWCDSGELKFKSGFEAIAKVYRDALGELARAE